MKNVKVGKNAKSERGKCPQYGFERVLNLEEVDPKSICMGGSNVHQPCFPPQVLTGYYGKGVCEKFEKHKVRKELVSKRNISVARI